MKGKEQSIAFSIIRSPWLWGSFVLYFFFHTPMAGKTLENAYFTEADLKTLRWRSVGPALFSGRIADIAIPQGQSHIVYCAGASWDIWKTESKGITWKLIFDDHGMGSMEAIAVAESDPNIIRAGTGEAVAANHST